MKKIFSIITSAAIVAIITLGMSKASLAQWTEANGPYSSTIPCFTSAGTTLFAGWQKGVFVSTDNGANWITYTNSLTNAGVICLAASSDGANIFASYGYSGPFLSTDNGKTWSQHFIGGNYNVSSLAVSGSSLFAGTNNGAFVSPDNGLTWDSVAIGLPANFRVSCFAFGTKVYIESQIGLDVSIDGGTTWTLANSSMTQIAAMAISGTDLFAAAGGVFRSQDDGKTWTEVDTGLAIKLQVNIVHGLAVPGNNLFAGTSTKGVFLSTDEGTTWKSFSAGLPNNGVPNNLVYSQVYSMAVTDSFVLAGFYQGGIWRLPLSQATASVAAQTSANDAVLPYPNPAAHSLMLSSLPGVVEVRVADATGRYVLSQKVSGGQTVLDVSGLPNGIYSALLLCTKGPQKIQRFAVCH